MGAVSKLMPSDGRPGGRWRDHHDVVNGLFWKLSTGVPWRDIPGRYGPWQTIYDRFVCWRRNGLFGRLLECLHLRLDEQGQIGRDVWGVLTAPTFALPRPPAAEKGDANEPDDHALGHSRGGFGTKIHLVTDGTGLALAVLLTSGQAAEVPCLQTLLAAVRSDRSPMYLIGVRAYSSRAARTWLLMRHIRPVIPFRADQKARTGASHGVTRPLLDWL